MERADVDYSLHENWLSRRIGKVVGQLNQLPDSPEKTEALKVLIDCEVYAATPVGQLPDRKQTDLIEGRLLALKTQLLSAKTAESYAVWHVVRTYFKKKETPQ